MSALTKIVRHSNSETTMQPNSLATDNYFDDYNFSQTTQHYEASIEKTVESRRELITCLKNQIEILLKVKVQRENISGVTQFHFNFLFKKKGFA